MYLDIEPYNSGMLTVSDLHQIYYEECGNKNGMPVIHVGGGPGRPRSPRDRQFFDPEVYRIILMDHRGSGRSTPAAEIKENTTWNLVSDIEKLREFLGVDKWVVFGGSWGSTLSLAYAETNPDRVKALVLRGIFTLRRRELAWLYQDGASLMFPDAWEEYIKPIPEVERCDLMEAYYRRLTGDDEDVKMACAKAWSRWELATSRLIIDPEYLALAEAGVSDYIFTREPVIYDVECSILNHFFVNGGFLETDDQLLVNAHKIRHIPTTIVQGRYDVQCPVETAWKLHKALPDAEFYIVPEAGHSNRETGIEAKLIEACEKYKHL